MRGSFTRRNQIGPSDRAVLRPQQKRRHLTNTDPADAAQRLYQRVDNAAMAIWRQQLQRLQSECRSHDDDGNKQHSAGVSQAERKSYQRKCRQSRHLR